MNCRIAYSFVSPSRYALSTLVLALFCLWSSLSPRQMAAQADTGRIVGQVKDPDGLAMPQTKITCTRVESNAVLTTETNKQGEFSFPSLPVGTYKLEAEHDGFQSAIKEGYNLEDGGRLTVDFTMKAGTSEQVIVTSTVGDTVNTQTGELAHVIDGEEVRDLPLNGRNYLDLLGTLPGSVVAPGQSDAIAAIISGNTTNTVLNGARGTSNGLYLDGVPNKDIGNNDRQFNNVGVDFINHVRVLSSGWSSEYGFDGGPAINAVTRSGSNQIHGSLFEYVQNNALNAANYYSKTSTGAPIKQHLRYNDVGGGVGGPIIKDKLFLYLGLEYKIIAEQTLPAVQTLPLQSQLAGNFLTAAGTCPLTLPGLNPKLCNISNFITPFGHAIQNTYAFIISQAASYAGTACTTTSCSNNGNTIFELPEPYRNHEIFVRGDYNITARQNMYVRWLQDDRTTVDPIGDGALPVDPERDSAPSNSVIVSHTTILSPSSYNEIAVAALWNHTLQVPVGNAWERSTYGYNYPQIYPGYPGKIGIPYVNISGYSTWNSEAYLDNSHTTYMEGHDNYTRIIGKHTVKAGVLLGRWRRDQNGGGGTAPEGQFTFNAIASNTNTTGNAVADALLGIFQNYQESSNTAYGFYRLWQGGVYVDDVWRVLPNLSLDVGVRMDVVEPWHDILGNQTNFYPGAYNPANAVAINPKTGYVTAGSGSQYNGLERMAGGVPSNETARVPGANSPTVLSVPATAPNPLTSTQYPVMPRLGFAYDLRGNGLMAIRGGAGIFYDTPQGNSFYSLMSNPPYVQVASVVNGYADNIATAAAGQGFVFGTVNAIDPHFSRPVVYQFNLGLEQQITKGLFFQVFYVGSEQKHLIRTPNINGIPPATADANYVNGINVNAQYQYAGFSTIDQWRTDVDGNYNSLQTHVTYGRGASHLSFSETWSKALSAGSVDTSAGSLTGELYNQHYYYGPVANDSRNVFILTYTLQAPPLRNRNAFLRYGFGGWSTSFIGRHQDGALGTFYANDAYGVQTRPNYAGYPIIYKKTAANWVYIINPGDVVNFSNPQPDQIGNAPVGDIIQPGFVQLDMQIRRNLLIRERYNLQVNASAFNVLNHPNFGGLQLNANGGTVTYYPGTTNIYSESEGLTSAARPRNIQGGLRISF